MLLTRRNITDLPFEVLEQAYWRPREAQLCCGYKPKDSQGKEFLRLRNMWRTREINLNFALDALLLCCTQGELGRFAGGLTGIEFGDAFLFSGYSMPLKKIIGVPDFVISDGNNCVLGEIKIGAPYEITQFIKYQTFAMLCRASSDLPSRITQVLLTANTSPEGFLSDYKKSWTPRLTKNRFVLKSSDVKHIKTRLSSNANLLSEKFNKVKSPIISEVPSVESLSKESNNLMETYVFSWTDFKDIFDGSTLRADLEDDSDQIRKLGMGTYTVVLDC